MPYAHCILIDKTVRERAAHFVRTAPDGYVMKIDEPKRTLAQNDLLWPLLTEISAQATLQGRTFTPDQWKAIFMQSLGHKSDFLPTLEGDGFFPTGFRSSKLSKREMADLLTAIMAFGDQNGVKFNGPIVTQAGMAA
jgi:hypothetical protein